MGILQGPSLSLVQVRALQILMEMEVQDRERRRADDASVQFRLAVVSNPNLVHSIDEVVAIFPEWDSNTETVITEITEEDIEDTEGEWQFTSDITPEEAQRLLGGVTSMPMSDLVNDAVSPYEDEGWR